MATITTRYTSNEHGAGIIRATGHGVRRTVRYDHALSIEANHERARDVLAAALAGGDEMTWHTVASSGGGRRYVSAIVGTVLEVRDGRATASGNVRRTITLNDGREYRTAADGAAGQHAANLHAGDVVRLYVHRGDVVKLETVPA